MSQALTAEAINDHAKKIAELIAEVPTDVRHVLYNCVAIHLRQRDQAYSAKLFQRIAQMNENGL